MRTQPSPRLDRYRTEHPVRGRTPKGVDYGYFEIPSGQDLMRVISSGHAESDGQWEHVSVSLMDRCPTWWEMCRVKDLFWGPHETVQQFHVARESHINIHDHCLHLWRQRGVVIPMPPTEAV